MADEEERAIRRILIAIDASPHSLAALQAAAELAARLDAELLGLYVEDINLLRLAELPIAREFSYYSGTANQLDRERIEMQLRAQASQARRALRNLAEHAQLRHSFRVTRGVIHSELLLAAEEVDLVILGRSGWSRRRQLGSTARFAIEQSPRHILIMHTGALQRQALGLVYDGSEVSLKALAVAATLLRSGEPLVILILADSVEKAQRLQEEASARLRQAELEGQYRWLVGSQASRLAALLRIQALGCLVIPFGIDTLPQEALIELLNKVNAPVLLVK